MIKYERIIATKERSAGNDSVGSMWNETKSFSKDTRIKEIIEWNNDNQGRLMITIDQDTTNDKIF